MKASDLQQELFRLIKAGLPAHSALVDVVSEVLAISTDSAYRRLRGDTALTLAEAALLARHAGISLDGLGGSNAETVVFTNRQVPQSATAGAGFGDFFAAIHKELTQLEQLPNAEIWVLAKDIPPFHLFNFPELAAFRTFFWAKHVVQAPELAHVEVYEGDPGKWLSASGIKALEAYCRIPSVEIWDDNSAQSLLLQIVYSVEAGTLRDRALARGLCDAAIALIDHMRAQATRGYKFVHGTDPGGREGNFRLYHNSFIVGENTFLVLLDEGKITYLNHHVLNYLKTTDEALGAATHGFLKNVMGHSTLLSGASQKERSRFFHLLRQRAEAVRDGI